MSMLVGPRTFGSIERGPTGERPPTLARGGQLGELEDATFDHPDVLVALLVRHARVV
jgi:hypothetical protein